MEKIKELWVKLPWWAKKHLASALKTFLATFLAVLAVQIDTINLDALEGSAIAAGVVVAFRFGVKALLEDVTAIISKKTNIQ